MNIKNPVFGQLRRASLGIAHTKASEALNWIKSSVPMKVGPARGAGNASTGLRMNSELGMDTVKNLICLSIQTPLKGLCRNDL